MKKRYRPKLDPKRDLAGATPELLVRALFRQNQPSATSVADARTLPNTAPEDSHARTKRSDRTQDQAEAHA